MATNTSRQLWLAAMIQAKLGAATKPPRPDAAMKMPIASARRRLNQRVSNWVPGSTVCIVMPRPSTAVPR